VSTLGLSLFVFGYGLGPMILAPFAEAPPIGRMPVYVLTHLIFIFLNFGVVYATNIGILLAFRFLTGFFGSPVLGIGGSSCADVWSAKKSPYAIGIWGVFALCGPVLGPLVAGFAVQAKGWHWSIWELIWLNGFTVVFVILALPETSADTILFRRAQQVRKMAGNPRYKSAAEIEVENTPFKKLFNSSLVRPFHLCFTEPILLVQNLYLGLVYAILYCWFEAFPLVFGGLYGFNLGQQGLAYLGILVGTAIFMPPYCLWIHRSIEPGIYPGSEMKPEKWLQAAIVGSLFLPVCMFWFGWSSRSSVHWIMPIIGSVWFSIGGGLLFNAILSYQSAAYPKVVGSILAGNDCMRAALGAGFPLFATAMFRNLGIGEKNRPCYFVQSSLLRADWGCSLLGFLTVLFIAIPIRIYVYGKQICSTRFVKDRDGMARWE
jgi:MFS transporter, DHA1 family, multidrug resistance protein